MIVTLAVVVLLHPPALNPYVTTYVPAEEMTLDHQIVADLANDKYALFAGAGGFDRFRSVVVDAFDGIEVRVKRRHRRGADLESDRGEVRICEIEPRVLSIELQSLGDHSSFADDEAVGLEQ